MGSLSGAIRHHLTTARSELAAVEHLLRIGIADKKLARLCQDATMAVGALEVLVDREEGAEE